MDFDLCRRSLTVRAGTPDEGDEKISARLATTTPVMEFDRGRAQVIPQVLIPEGMRVDSPSGRDDQLPLVDGHDTGSVDNQLGSLRNIRVDGDSVVADLHFAADDKSQRTEQKVRDGHLTDLSVGFVVAERTFIEPGETRSVGGRDFTAGERGLNIATRWTAKEGSLVPVGADYASKVLRAFQEFNQTNQTNQTNMKEKATATAEETEKRSAITTAEPDPQKEKTRVDEIRALGSRFEVDKREIDMAELRGDSADDFRGMILERLQKESPIAPDGHIGMNDREIRAFSMTRAVSKMHYGNSGVFGPDALDGVEREAHDELSRSFTAATGEQPRGLLIPAELVLGKRQMATTPDTAGGHTIATEHRPLIEFLRERLIMGELGATVLTGLMSNLKWPRRTNALAATWPGEQGATTPGALTFGELLMSPKRVTAETEWTLQIAAQSSEDVENLNRGEATYAIAEAIDRAALFGAGTADEPEGLFNASGTQSVTFGTGAPAWASLLEFDQKIEESNAPGSNNTEGNAPWLTTSNVKAVWKATEKAAGSGHGFLADPWPPEFRARANGAAIHHFNHASMADRVVKGIWSNLYIGLWGGIEVVVDPYTNASNGRVRVVTSWFADTGLRHGSPFVISTDKGDGTNV